MSARRFRKATLREVASEAGVSSTTVSLFMNGREDVCSAETGERIRKAILALNYTPNSLTRGLRKGELITIGIFMQNPDEDEFVFGSLYLEQIWRGVMRQADEEYYSLLRYAHAVSERTSDIFLDGRVDGMLLHDHLNDRAIHLCNAGMPTVFIDRRLNIPEGCGSAYANQADIIDLGLSHLWQLGHRRIAFVAGPVAHFGPAQDLPASAIAFPDGDPVAIDRLQSYQDWMARRRELDPDLVGHTQTWWAPHAHAMLRRWRTLDKPPTAVLCSNDTQAVEIIAAAKAVGLNIPGDLSVVGVDDSPSAATASPPITSVRVPMIQVGKDAVRALLRLIRGAPIKDCRIAVPVTDITIRSSTAPPSQGG